ncbi:EAL domain-containing protein [Tropicimonas sp. TH_r6]|nr:EAL domain-containing protein [Tropicimonas sp. TH_r6]
MFDRVFAGNNSSSVWTTLVSNPIHFIILLAPLVLGATGLLIGRSHERLRETVQKLSAAEREQWRLANHDTLTGLGNRLKLMSDMVDAQREHGRQIIVLMDLNRFKSINDNYGHEAGDSVLCHFAQTLRSVLPSDVKLYRLGGDEFLALFPTGVDAERASQAVSVITSQSKEPKLIGDAQLKIGVSLGLTSLRSEDQQSSDAIQRADIALYRAKSEVDSALVVFEDKMMEEIGQVKTIQTDLDAALRRGELYVEYQPIHKGETNALVGAEALLRWRHPLFGNLPPDKFIGVAEETDQIVQLGHLVLENACRAATFWPDDLWVSANISIKHFQRAGFHEEVLDILLVTGLPPHRLVIEITETMLIEDRDAVMAAIGKLHKNGIRISLDDFGEGYTSVKNLVSLGLDQLKIDMSLTRGIDQSSRSRGIVSGIVTIGKAIDIESVIEGIERNSELQEARKMGIDLVQGYYFSKPLGRDQFADYCRSYYLGSSRA